MDIEKRVCHWLAISNQFDTDAYLQTYHKDAILEDLTIGEFFKGHRGIKKYFEEHFIGYKTQTRILKLTIVSNNKIHIDAQFNGSSFRDLNGVFELTFEKDKIKSVKAYLT